ncbi:MAG: GNAT family N-acetyltransferase, partial [Butyrivibrio sp.]|nr:GNAT family N-acetyltransferase [Butyrivibrio sp.]
MIERTEDEDGVIGELVGEEFTKFALKKGIDTAYVSYCFVAKDGDKIAGAIQGHAYYKEVHIGDLIVLEEYRKSGA